MPPTTIRAEYWVMRVFRHQHGRMAGRPVRMEHMTIAAQIAAMASMHAGLVVVLPDGSLAEPCEVFEDQIEAEKHRRVLQDRMEREDFRLVLNADCLTD